jgi:hypothetical protein
MLGGTIGAAHANVAMDVPARANYDAHQSCHYYLNHNLPGPKRCTRFFSNALGSHAYVSNGFVFRDHDTFVRFRDRGWFTDETQLAAREDRPRAREEDRAREHDEMRAEKEKQYAGRDDDEGSGGASRGDVAHGSGSGGASRGDGARDSGSGGASRGATVYPKAESGGAGHGERAHRGGSGGASGY